MIWRKKSRGAVFERGKTGGGIKGLVKKIKSIKIKKRGK
jgi:hypothetical protein